VLFHLDLLSLQESYKMEDGKQEVESGSQVVEAETPVAQTTAADEQSTPEYVPDFGS
jgi:hypothetical protein